MSLSTAAERYRGQPFRPLGLAVDAGTGSVRAQLYWLDDGEWIGDGPLDTEYFTSQTSHDPPHVLLAARDGEWALQQTMRKLLERQPELLRQRLRAIGIDGHMHAPAFIERDGKITRPMQMWNSAAAAPWAARLRQRVDWHVPDRVTVAHIFREWERDPVAFRREVATVTTKSGLLGFRLTGRHGLDPCEHSGLGVNDPQTGQVSDQLAAVFDFPLRDLLPPRLAPDQYLGRVTESGCQWLGVPAWWACGAVVAAPGGDQGAGRDGLGCRMHHAGLVLGTSVVVTTETTARPAGRQFDPFQSSHGHCLNMGLYANGMRTGDALFEQLLRTPEFRGDKTRLFQTLGQEAERDAADCGGDFALSMLTADPSLGVNSQIVVPPPADATRGRRWRLLWMQQVMSIELRLQALAAGGPLPDVLVVGGAAARDDDLLQTLADGLGIRLLRPQGSEKAMLEGMKDRGRLAEELAAGPSGVDPETWLQDLRAEPEGRSFQPRTDRRGAFSAYRQRFLREIGR